MRDKAVSPLPCAFTQGVLHCTKTGDEEGMEEGAKRGGGS